jgi:hypothetical protein
MIERNPLMFTGEGDFERGRREANEGRERIARRARIEAEEASAARTRLERGSPSSGRRNFAGMLNALAKGHAEREAPSLLEIIALREIQKSTGYKTAADHNRAHARFEKAVGGEEGFNRLHPLARGTSVPRDPEWNEPGHRGYKPGTSVAPGAGDADARDERFVSPLRARALGEVAGKLIADARTMRDHGSSGQVTGISPEWLLDAACVLLEEAREMAAGDAT